MKRAATKYWRSQGLRLRVKGEPNTVEDVRRRLNEFLTSRQPK
jgi:hypothetical protein